MVPAFTVIYDANVLYPSFLRDVLMRLAMTDLYRARWTEDIHREWMRSLAEARPDLVDSLPRIRALMDNNVRDCLVTGYAELVEGLQLPDPDDRHVLAAAIRAQAQQIVTYMRLSYIDHPNVAVFSGLSGTAEAEDGTNVRPSIRIRAA